MKKLTETEYRAYLLRIEELMVLPEDEMTDEQGDELIIKAFYVEQYEKEKYPIDTSSVVIPYWLDDFIYFLEQTELEDGESCCTEYMKGYYAGCRDTKISLAAQLRYKAESNGND